MWETWVRPLGWEDPLEKEMAIHSSTIAWKIPWTVEPGRLQSMGSQRVGHDWSDFTSSRHFSFPYQCGIIRDQYQKIFENSPHVFKCNVMCFCYSVTPFVIESGWYIANQNDEMLKFGGERVYLQGSQARRWESNSQTCFPEGKGLRALMEQRIRKQDGLRLRELGKRCGIHHSAQVH